MKKLNLTVKGHEQELILAYLQENASDILADKINNGVYINKKGKQILNKKTLDGFMNYACDEACKQSEESARGACVQDNIVFGWAIHYFEEDSIEGTLYNEDGSEYRPVVAKPNSQSTTPTKSVKPQNTQASIFDFMQDETPNKQNSNEQLSNDMDDNNDIDNQQSQGIEGAEDYMPTSEEIGEILAELAEEDRAEAENKPKGSPLYQEYMSVQNHYPADIVAYWLGDFYEVFGENAVIIGNELDLTITGRDCGLDERVPMIGFPYHIADICFNKIAKTHSIVVADDKNNIRRIPKHVIDRDTGEIIETPDINDRIDKTLLPLLSDILGEIFIVR